MAKKRGLQDADCHDLVQRILVNVALAIGRWRKKNPESRFRHWLKKVTRNAFLNEITRRPNELAEGGTTALALLEQECADEESSNEFDKEYRRELFLQAAIKVRAEVEASTWRAFEMTVLEDHSIETASHDLSKSVGSIYAARSRVTQRLRDVVLRLEDLDK
jgi:RNA polymerase sigma-70 factor (ECF subfamily)